MPAPVVSQAVVGEPVAASRAEVGLKPSMHGFGALLITLSCLSPSIGVFIVGSDVIRQAGTGVFACFAAAALLGLAMAAVYAELASAFPETGGEYTILGRALGPAAGIGALGLNLVGFSIAQALSGVGAATYLATVWPGLPPVATAAGLVAAVTLVAVLNIRVGAWVTGLFLAVEIAALAVLAGLGLLHPHRGLAAGVLHPVMAAAGGGLAPTPMAVLGVAAAGGVYAFNGYGAVVFLGEELHEAPKRIARVVFLALGAAVVTELLPILAVVLGARDLRALVAAPAPVPAFLVEAGGPRLARLMSLGVALAIVNAMIAVALIGGRQLYSTGRDRLWPAPVSRTFARIHPRWGSPWLATLVMGATALAACLIDQKLLVILLGNGNVVMYAALSVAVIAGRRSGATRHAGFRMPLYPLAPLAALAALAGVAWFDLHDEAGAQGLAASAAVAGASALYYVVVLRRRVRRPSRP